MSTFSGPSKALLVYYDRKGENLTDALKPLWPGATWKDFKAKKTGSIGTWVETVKTYLNGLPEGVEKISSQSLRVAVDAKEVPSGTWRDVMKSLGEDRTLIWKLQGRTWQRLFSKVAA